MCISQSAGIKCDHLLLSALWRLFEEKLKYKAVSSLLCHFYRFYLPLISVCSLNSQKCWYLLKPHIRSKCRKNSTALLRQICDLGFIGYLGTPIPKWTSLVAQLVKNLPAVQETWVWFLGWEDSLENGMATHSSILAWRIPWTEEPGGLQSIGLQRVRWVKRQRMNLRLKKKKRWWINLSSKTKRLWWKRVKSAAEGPLCQTTKAGPTHTLGGATQVAGVCLKGPGGCCRACPGLAWLCAASPARPGESPSLQSSSAPSFIKWWDE